MNKRLSAIRTSIVFGTVLLTAGCTGFRSPAISVEKVAATRMTGEALALAIVMRLENPNNAPLELHEFRYTVSIDGTKVYAGRRAGGATLSANGTRQVTIPAVVNYDRIGWRAGGPPRTFNYALDGTLTYNAPSEIAQVLFDTGVRRPRVSFSKRGEVALP